MKFRITFKTPDATGDLTLDNVGDEETFQQVKSLLKKYVKYDEIITIEFDTETMTATVVEA